MCGPAPRWGGRAKIENSFWPQPQKFAAKRFLALCEVAGAVSGVACFWATSLEKIFFAAVRRTLHCLHHKQPLNGTPAVHDHNPVGAKLHPGATSVQSPCRCTTTSGVPFTRESTAGPSGIVRTFSPSAGTVTNKVPQFGSPQLVYPPNTQPSGGGGGTSTAGGTAGGSGA